MREKTASLNFWLRASRPRFWLYVLGPALLGLAASDTLRLELIGVPSIASADGWLLAKAGFLLLWLTWPINLFLYGVNDLYDEETDVRNLKKQTKEVLLQSARRRQMKLVVWSIAIISILLGWMLNGPARLFWFLFLFLGWAYSAPPLRFKTRLFLDAYSNVLYVLSAWVVYGIAANKLLPLPWLLVGMFWTAGMHTFSAIPDIDADRAAGEKTTAVRIGYRWALLFVGANWLVAALAAARLVGPVGLLLLIYPLLVTLVALNRVSAERSYWWFPWINGIIGMTAFWYIIWNF